MVVFMILLAVLAVYDFQKMIQAKQKKEYIVYSVFLAVAALFGTVYSLNPHMQSISALMLNLFNIKR